MDQHPIGSLDQPITEKDLHDLMLELADRQELAERMLVTTRHGGWHLALSLLRRETDPNYRSALRRMADFVIGGLGRTKRENEDTGSFLMEDLPVHGPKDRDTHDLVVSWGDNVQDLIAEVKNIRHCLDTLGIFDEKTSRDLGVHVDTGETAIGQARVQYENADHELRLDGKFRLSALLRAAGHWIPGLGKAEIGGHVTMRIPYEDSREKFIAALLASQMQSGGLLPTCTDMDRERENFPTMTAQELQDRWSSYIHPARSFLSSSLQGIDEQLRRAFASYPQDTKALMHYETCLSALQTDRPSLAISQMESLGRFSLQPIKKAMGENFYLFAANVIMQVQLQQFEKDLDQNLQQRFGVRLLKTPTKPESVPETTEPKILGTNPPTFLRRGPRR